MSSMFAEIFESPDARYSPITPNIPIKEVTPSDTQKKGVFMSIPVKP